MDIGHQGRGNGAPHGGHDVPLLSQAFADAKPTATNAQAAPCRPPCLEALARIEREIAQQKWAR